MLSDMNTGDTVALCPAHWGEFCAAMVASMMPDDVAQTLTEAATELADATLAAVPEPDEGPEPGPSGDHAETFAAPVPRKTTPRKRAPEDVAAE